MLWNCIPATFAYPRPHALLTFKCQACSCMQLRSVHFVTEIVHEGSWILEVELTFSLSFWVFFHAAGPQTWLDGTSQSCNRFFKKLLYWNSALRNKELPRGTVLFIRRLISVLIHVWNIFIFLFFFCLCKTSLCFFMLQMLIINIHD